jgi:hypothetical protein
LILLGDDGSASVRYEGGQPVDLHARLIHQLHRILIQHSIYGDQKIAANLDALRAGLFEYTEILYNRQRRHSAIDYVSPEQFESKPNPMNVSTFLG